MSCEGDDGASRREIAAPVVQQCLLDVKAARAHAASGRWLKASISWVDALRAVPSLWDELRPEVFLALDCAAVDPGDHPKVLAATFIEALRLHPPSPEVLLQGLGLLYEAHMKRSDLAMESYRRALSCNPDYAKARCSFDNLLIEYTPRWHFRMLNDRPRNEAYQAAIAASCCGKTVLDIGCGTGLLSILAAQAGAKHVYAVDEHEAMCAMAQRTVSLHGVADRVTLLRGNSHSLKVPDHMPERVDVLVTETVDSGLLGELTIPTLRHAAKHLVKPEGEGGRIIPEKATVYAVLIESDEIARLRALRDPATLARIVMGCTGSSKRRGGAESRLAAALSGPAGVARADLPYTAGDLSTLPHRVLSKPFEARTVRFLDDPKRVPADMVEVEVIADGRADAVAMWFDLHLGAGGDSSNSESSSSNSEGSSSSSSSSSIAAAGDSRGGSGRPGGESNNSGSGVVSTCPGRPQSSWDQALYNLRDTRVSASKSAALGHPDPPPQLVAGTKITIRTSHSETELKFEIVEDGAEEVQTGRDENLEGTAEKEEEEKEEGRSDDPADVKAKLETFKKGKTIAVHEPDMALLNDYARHEAFSAAIRSAVMQCRSDRGGAVVMDLCLDWNLTQLMAIADPGTSKVVPVTGKPPFEPEVEYMLSLARAIDLDMGQQSKIHLKDRALPDVPSPLIDVIVAADLIGVDGRVNASRLDDIRTVRALYSTPGAVVVPRAVHVWACAVESPHLRYQNRIERGNQCGLDVSILDEYTVSSHGGVSIEQTPHRPLMEPICVGHLDMAPASPIELRQVEKKAGGGAADSDAATTPSSASSAPSIPPSSSAASAAGQCHRQSFLPTASGKVDAVMFWFSLDLGPTTASGASSVLWTGPPVPTADDGAGIRHQPTTTTSSRTEGNRGSTTAYSVRGNHWRQGAYLPSERLQVEAGSPVLMDTRIDEAGTVCFRLLVS